MRTLVLIVLICISATLAFRIPRLPNFGRPILTRPPKIRFDDMSDIAWVPAAMWAGKALAGGALGAAGKHAYDRVFRRRDSEESDWSVTGNVCFKTKYGTICGSRDTEQSDIAWVPAAIWAGKAFAGGALAGAGAHAYDRFIRRRRDSEQSDIAWVPAAMWAGKAFAGGALAGAGAHAYDRFIRRRRDSEQSDIAWVPAAMWAGKALAGAGVGLAGRYTYNRLIRDRVDRRRDSEESDIITAAIGAWRLYNALKKKDNVESDAEFLGKLINRVKNVAGKVKGVVEKGKAAYANGKNIFDSAKNIIGLFKKPKSGDSEQSDLVISKLKELLSKFKQSKKTSQQ